MPHPSPRMCWKEEKGGVDRFKRKTVSGSFWFNIFTVHEKVQLMSMSDKFLCLSCNNAVSCSGVV